MPRQKDIRISNQANETPGVDETPGVSVPFFSRRFRPEAGYRLFIAVQPFADEVANHTSRDGNDKGYKMIQIRPLLPATSLGAVTSKVYHILFFITMGKTDMAEKNNTHKEAVKKNLYNRRGSSKDCLLLYRFFFWLRLFFKGFSKTQARLHIVRDRALRRIRVNVSAGR